MRDFCGCHPKVPLQRMDNVFILVQMCADQLERFFEQFILSFLCQFITFFPVGRAAR